MASPTVETFEHDIASEIRQKEASITDIASAVGDIGNNENDTPKNTISPLISVIVIIVLCVITGAGYLGYSYYQKEVEVTPQPNTENTQQTKTQPGVKLSTISPTIDQAIGTFLTNIEKTKLGYSMTILSYSPVFAYMIKNESAFAEDLGKALGNSSTIKKVTPTNPTTPVSTSASSTSTSTQATASSTSIQEEELPTTYTFYDVTISNQNMRVAKSAYGTVIYAFIGSKQLVISSSTEGILAFRANLLRK